MQNWDKFQFTLLSHDARPDYHEPEQRVPKPHPSHTQSSISPRRAPRLSHPNKCIADQGLAPFAAPARHSGTQTSKAPAKIRKYRPTKAHLRPPGATTSLPSAKQIDKYRSRYLPPPRQYVFLDDAPSGRPRRLDDLLPREPPAPAARRPGQRRGSRHGCRHQPRELQHHRQEGRPPRGDVRGVHLPVSFLAALSFFVVWSCKELRGCGFEVF